VFRNTLSKNRLTASSNSTLTEGGSVFDSDLVEVVQGVFSPPATWPGNGTPELELLTASASRHTAITEFCKQKTRLRLPRTFREMSYFFLKPTTVIPSVSSRNSKPMSNMRAYDQWRLSTSTTTALVA